MLPVGYPIPWQCKGYNVRMRGVFIINPQFAYCHGLSHVMRSDSETRDFLLRYMTNRSLQDLLQPMVSAAQKTLTSVIFMPGRITHNLKPEDVKPLLQGQLPQSAIQMYELFEKNLDEDSISKIVAGQEPSGDPTAYQISVQQKMAARALGPIVFNFMWLLQDMDFLRAQTILEFISKPKSTMIDPVSKEVIATYNSLMLEDADVGEGVIGNHLIKFQPTSKHPSELEVLKEEDELSNFEGKQMRVSYLDGEAVRNLRYKITNTVKSSPRKNSDTNKILFGNFMDNAMNYFGGTVNLSYLQNEFARVWEKDPEKVFNQNVQPVPQVATKQPTGSQQVKNKVVAGVVNDSVV
jgi:hypothetical protein